MQISHGNPISEGMFKSRSSSNSRVREKMDKSSASSSSLKRKTCLAILAFAVLWWVIVMLNFLTFEAPPRTIPTKKRQEPLRSTSSEDASTTSTVDLRESNEHLWKPLERSKDDPCAGRYVYMYTLPRELNEGMIDDCKQLSVWTDMCKFTANHGMGPPLEDPEGSFTSQGWYATNQFAGEVIFHNRMKQYECLTNDSSLAAAVFVPYYAGLDVSRYLWGYNTTVRDAGAVALVAWLREQKEWKRLLGRDHFMVAGRITWDFRRKTDRESDWGNKLFMIPELKNVTNLVIEASPWHFNDFAIPYPTYFHPKRDADVVEWQSRMRDVRRSSLFSFAGAPRQQLRKSIRERIMEQCRVSEHCNLLECDFGESKCHVPSVVMKLFQGSVFCVQPQGDSFTRRSIFDSMLAGCIPVFFHPDSAYSQFVWHLPSDYRKYSVFISEIDVRRNNVTIEEVLLRVPPEEVVRMREEVIKLIPGLLYADPRSRLETMKDAFDIAVQAVIDKNSKLRWSLLTGRGDPELAKLHRKEGEEMDELDGSESSILRWQAQVQGGALKP